MFRPVQARGGQVRVLDLDLDLRLAVLEQTGRVLLAMVSVSVILVRDVLLPILEVLIALVDPVGLDWTLAGSTLP